MLHATQVPTLMISQLHIPHHRHNCKFMCFKVHTVHLFYIANKKFNNRILINAFYHFLNLKEIGDHIVKYP